MIQDSSQKLSQSGQTQLKILRPFRKEDWLFLAFLIIFSIFYLSGVPRIPFHPDESTQIYMSQDFRTLFSNPAVLFWRAEGETDPAQRYRELDAPITRDLIGLAGLLTSTRPLLTDWDWGKTWTENSQAGALPSPRQLLVARLGISLLFPLTLIWIYLAGRRLGYPVVGFLAALVLALHPLSLLHSRRAMAEGPLLFGIAVFIYACLSSPRKTWLIGLAAVIAVNSKQSAYALIPVGLIAVAWTDGKTSRPVGWILSRCIQYSGILLAGIILLNPLLWSQPVEAIQASWTARQSLVAFQVEDLRRVAPYKVMDNPGERLSTAVVNLYIAPPAFQEYPNYTDEIASQAAAYLTSPGNELFQGLVWGSLFLFLTLTGMVYALWMALRRTPVLKQQFLLLILGTTALTAGLCLTVPLPFQRYFIPLLPWISIWIAGGCTAVGTAVIQITHQKRMPRTVGPGQEL